MQILLRFIKEHRIRFIYLLIVLMIGTSFLTLIAPFLINKLYHTEKNSVSSDKNTTSLSKSAVDDLVTKAADDKYIRDVLGDKTLPAPKHPIALQPYNNNSTTAPINIQKPVYPQRCNYKNQLYVTGDIVKTNQGWIRCTPTITFSTDQTNTRQAGIPAWTAVQ